MPYDTEDRVLQQRYFRTVHCMPVEDAWRALFLWSTREQCSPPKRKATTNRGSFVLLEPGCISAAARRYICGPHYQRRSNKSLLVHEILLGRADNMQ